MLPLSPFTGTVAIRRSPRVFMPLLVSVARRRMVTDTSASPITSAKLSSHHTKDKRDVPHIGTEGLHSSTHRFAAKIGGT
jgi:hypothetical protein